MPKRYETTVSRSTASFGKEPIELRGRNRKKGRTRRHSQSDREEVLQTRRTFRFGTKNNMTAKG